MLTNVITYYITYLVFLLKYKTTFDLMLPVSKSKPFYLKVEGDLIYLFTKWTCLMLITVSLVMSLSAMLGLAQKLEMPKVKEKENC